MTNPYCEATLGELANRAAADFGEHEFVYFQGDRYTFRQARERIDRTARGLMALGVEPGEKVGLWMTNRPEWIDVMFACAKIGTVLVPINTRFRTADLDYVLRQSNTSMLITMDESGPIRYFDMVREACPELLRQDRDSLRCKSFPDLRRVVNLGRQKPSGVYGWDELLQAAEDVPPAELQQRESAVSPEDTLFIMYTSGTTGFPQGVMQPHGALVYNLKETCRLLETTADDVTVMFLPLFHCFGYQQGPIVSMVAGCRMVLTETFDPGETLELIGTEGGTMLHGFDTHWQALMEHPNVGRTDLGTLRLGILAAGLPSTAPIARRAYELLCPTISGWGMTEVLAGATIGRLGDSVELSTLASGNPMRGNEVKVINPATGEELPPETEGELCMRGYGVMQGYYNKPDETASMIDGDGWLHSGDRAVLRGDGYIRFLGRYKEMLKIGGENVDPVEVEAFFAEHPKIARIQIVGVPDRHLSEVPVAFIVADGDNPPSEEELTAFAGGKLASFKIPRHYFIVDDYPMTPSGKVKKFELRKAARERLGITEEDIEQPVPEMSSESG